MKAFSSAVLALALGGTAFGLDSPPLHPNANVVVGTNHHGSGAPDGFGSSSFDVSTISWSDFFPRIDTVAYSSDGGTGKRWITGGPSNFLYAPLTLDHGVVLGGFDIYFEDSSAAADLTVQFCRYWRDTIGGTNASADCVAAFTSAGAPGDDWSGLSVPAQFSSILRRGNIDADPAIEAIDYVLLVSFGGSVDGTVRISQIRPYWRRQVSLAPAVATFPNDVPTSHAYFRFIEALAAAGITGGCAPGSYCPDNPITRGEMAVFLAAALGLHWSPF